MPGPVRARLRRLIRVSLVTAVVIATASLLAASSSPAPASARTTPAGHPPPPPAGRPLAGVASYLGSREGVVQVAVYDPSTGQTSLLSTGHATQYTASIVKADILAMWLRRYQGRAAPIPGVIPFSIKYLMTNMITMSDNVAATSLFYFGGGCTALTAFNTLIPTRATSVGCETPTYYGWGNTTTTAADQARIVRTIAYPNRVLAPDARSYAQQLMESIIPAQRWGVTCGPWGTTCDPPGYATPVPGVTVALKNGWKFVPTCTQQDDTCPWQVNSIGWVHGDGRDYVLAVLTTDDPAGPGLVGFNYGITTIQGVSQLVWDNLAP
jgi:beta-lactamase class A